MQGNPVPSSNTLLIMEHQDGDYHVLPAVSYGVLKIMCSLCRSAAAAQNDDCRVLPDVNHGVLDIIGILIGTIQVSFRVGLLQDPKAAAAQMVVSPLTGEMVPYDQMEEHMRINLIDPRCSQTASLVHHNRSCV